MTLSDAKILVTGINGVVGFPLCQRLNELQITYKTLSRSSVGGDGTHVSKATSPIQWDLNHRIDEPALTQLGECDTLFHCAPIWLLPVHLEALHEKGLKRIVVFSSSSVISKANSMDASENQLVQVLSGAETALTEFCANHDIALTIFRPSMIYGYARDQNITHISKFIRRYHFICLVGEAKGLRQPVHAQDLVDACLAVLDNSATFGNTYNLAGAEVISYRVMVKRIFLALELTPRIISLPLFVYRFALRIAKLFGRFSYTPEMADRMNQNLIYDCVDAEQDFGYMPQKFLCNPKQDLLTKQSRVD